MRAGGCLPKAASAFLLALVFATTAYWLHLDRVDLSDLDCGGHALYALRLHRFMMSPSRASWRALSEDIAYYYPPLTQFIGALSMFALKPSGDALILTSLFVFGTLLFLACNGLERMLTKGEGGLPVSGYMSLLAPGLVNLSRRYYLDFPLAAMVCTGVYCLVRSENFRNRKGSVLFGVVAGLGMLTKWTYPIFLAAPVILALFRSKPTRHTIKNIALASLIPLVIAAPWYIASLDRIVWNFLRFRLDARLTEMAPVLSSSSLVFYPRYILQGRRS